MISVLLPTYNGERFIADSVESVLNQSFGELQLLVGINGPREETEKILSKFNDERLSVIHLSDKPMGVSKTLNDLLPLSVYEYVAIQDDDDIWMRNKLEKQIRFLDANDVIGSQISYIDEEGKTPTAFGYGPRLCTSHEDICKLTKAGQNQVANSASIINKKKIEDNNGWDPQYPGYEDMDMWLKLMSKDCKFYNSNEILVQHRVYPKSRFNAKQWDMGDLLTKYK